MEALKKSAEPLKGEPSLRHGSGLIRPAEALAML
jgi:hypothetical protein